MAASDWLAIGALLVFLGLLYLAKTGRTYDPTYNDDNPDDDF